MSVSGSLDRPRLAVFRSNRYLSAQIIDDSDGKTFVSYSAKLLKDKGEKSNGVSKSESLGEKIAELAMQKKIKQVVFDRSGYKYHGKIKAVADGARKGGLLF